MSLATVDTAFPRTRRRLAASAAVRPAAAPRRRRRSAPAPRIRAVPNGTEARGFVLYVGIDEAKAAAAGTDLGRIVEALKRLTAELAPSAETYAAVALAPDGAGGRDVDVVRLALQDPAAIAKHRHAVAVDEDEDRAAAGVVVDISRKRLLLDNQTAALTYKEFELLQYLVLREGRTIERAELISLAVERGRRGRGPERAHHRRARAPPARQARPLRGHRAHRARRRLPLRPPRRRLDPPRERPLPRPVLTAF